MFASGRPLSFGRQPAGFKFVIYKLCMVLYYTCFIICNGLSDIMLHKLLLLTQHKQYKDCWTFQAMLETLQWTWACILLLKYEHIAVFSISNTFTTRLPFNRRQTTHEQDTQTRCFDPPLGPPLYLPHSTYAILSPPLGQPLHHYTPCVHGKVSQHVFVIPSTKLGRFW